MNTQQMENNGQAPEQPAIRTAEDIVAQHQAEWSNVVHELENMARKFSDLPDLMGVIYGKKQDAIDYYHNVLGTIAKQNRKYKVAYATKYNYYKNGSQIRYNSDAAINAQIACDLVDMQYTSDILENHAKYMESIISNISNIIYGIPTRIKLEEISRGLNLS